MNQRLFTLLTLLGYLFISNFSFAQKAVNNDEKPVVLFVEFEFDTKDMGQAIELLTEMQNQTIENEEGCIAYDILLHNEQPNTIYMYECYENSAALKHHNNTSYFKSIVDKKLTPLIKNKKILTLSPINEIGVMM
ncbi:MAG: putative quinol monooxygenase [Dysgonamonadaceae bacterium]|nr:putative quinol monooxygenase [Dysgonamonadaceae bacterium]MDD4728958.1 putative quinol monooxygenase [Dysgonamonadaceae bacterium]